jgi:hypothetical protein
VQFKGHGVHLELPALPLTGPVEVQLKQASNVVCWGAKFSIPFTKNDAASFLDKSD